MLTPSFELQQNKDFLTIIIKAPFAKVAETEIFIEENGFKFYSKPYFLRLTLPGNIVEDGREKADYDVEKGIFTVLVPKETSGEHFEGLDMLTKLLAPQKKTKDVSPLIEVINDDDDDSNIGNDNTDNDDGDDFDWCIEQEPYVEKQGLLDAPKYGFANQKSGVFQRLQEEMVYVVDCPDPDQCNLTDRRKLRLDTEWEKFDEDHYLADLFEDENIQQILNYKPRFYDEVKLLNIGQSVEKIIEFDDDERDILKKLPRKEYILDSIEKSHVYLGLVDIIYAYTYNHRCTEGENHCESGWTISKISATLSWLEVFTSIKEVIQCCYRRSLCYPLYRHWCLNDTVLHDVIQILRLGTLIWLPFCCYLHVFNFLDYVQNKTLRKRTFLTCRANYRQE
ncbi:Hsp90 cochaperone shq1 [Mactra antiquata]